MALSLPRRFESPVEPSLARAFLVSEGIMSFIFDVENQWDTLAPTCRPARLMVPEEDLDDAARLLDEAGA